MFVKYDIVIVDLNPKKGHVQSGVRSCVIIQSNLFNGSASTVIVVPLTSVDKKIFPSEFWIEPSRSNGLSVRSRFLGSQIMSVDFEFVVQHIGHLEEEYCESIREALSISLDWGDEF